MPADELMRLIALRGVEGKREYLLKEEIFVIGSTAGDPPVDLPIDLPDVLPKHATMRRDGETYHLEPAPGARVLVNRHEFNGGLLQDGDQVAFGGALFQFWAGGLKGKPPRPYSPAGGTDAGGATQSEPGASSAEDRPRRITRQGVTLFVLILLAALLLLLILRQGPLGPRP